MGWTPDIELNITLAISTISARKWCAFGREFLAELVNS
jgi:hypothetical protein